MRRALPIVVAALLLSASAHAAEPDGTAEAAAATVALSPWSLELGVVGPQLAAGGWGDTGQLRVAYRFSPHWFAEGSGRAGVVLDAPVDDADELYGALAFGAGWATGDSPQAWDTRVSGRFTHVHHATFASWGDTPSSNLLGDSGGGVQHRSGAELAVGLLPPALNRLDSALVIWGVEATAGVLPSSARMRWTVGLTGFLGVRWLE